MREAWIAIVVLSGASAFQGMPIAARGMYTYQADAGVIIDCTSGATTAVRGGQGAAALERAYLVYRREPGQPLLVTLQARIVTAPGSRESGGGTHLEVDKFLGVWPAETCGRKGPSPPLVGTTWALTRLGDQPIVPGKSSRDPELQFLAADHRLTATGGCNQFIGTYTSEQGRLTIAGLASTRMACPAGMEIDNAFQAALTAVQRWSIDGQHLTLTGARGQPELRFEAKRAP